MIVVSTGTNGKPFDRLLRAVAVLHTTEEVVVQHGPSTLRPVGARCIASMSFEEYACLVKKARVVITHGGVGSVLVALMFGQRPLVLPRLARFDEAVDDHQLFFARRLDAAGLITLVEDPEGLTQAFERARGTTRLPPADTRESALVAELRAYCQAAAGRPPRHASPTDSGRAGSALLTGDVRDDVR